MKNNIFYRYQSPRGFVFRSIDFSAQLSEISFKIDELFQKHGCIKVMPPTVDYAETFKANTSSNFFSIRDSDDRQLALRNDVTLQIIKGVSNQLDLIQEKNKEYAFCYQLPVFQNYEPSDFRAREVFQVGMEVLQYQDPFKVVSDLLCLGNKILTKILDVQPTFCISTVDTFHVLRKILTNVTYLNLDEIIFSRNIPKLAVLFKNLGLESTLALKLSKLLLFDYINDDWFIKMNELEPKFPVSLKKMMKKLMKHVEEVLKLEKSLSDTDFNVYSLALLSRKVNYYTGFIFEGHIEGVVQSPFRGGCYDLLVSEYSDGDVSAAGFSLELSTIFEKD